VTHKGHSQDQNEKREKREKGGKVEVSRIEMQKASGDEEGRPSNPPGLGHRGYKGGGEDSLEKAEGTGQNVNADRKTSRKPVVVFFGCVQRTASEGKQAHRRVGSVASHPSAIFEGKNLTGD